MNPKTINALTKFSEDVSKFTTLIGNRHPWADTLAGELAESSQDLRISLLYELPASQPHYQPSPINPSNFLGVADSARQLINRHPEASADPSSAQYRLKAWRSALEEIEILKKRLDDPLVKAAPDLLAACENLLRVDNEGSSLHPPFAVIEAAVKKATGQ